MMFILSTYILAPFGDHCTHPLEITGLACIIPFFFSPNVVVSSRDVI
jgi:hypothetical protein